MAIAPSRLGRLVQQYWASDDMLVRQLRELRLVAAETRDDDLKSAFARARQEHAEYPEGMQSFTSPNERVRVFLEPYLTRRGRRWAVPLKSLQSMQEPWWIRFFRRRM